MKIKNIMPRLGKPKEKFLRNKWCISGKSVVVFIPFFPDVVTYEKIVSKIEELEKVTKDHWEDFSTDVNYFK